MNAHRLAFAAFAVASFAGCHCGAVVTGSGVSSTEERTLDKPYHRVEVSDSLDVKLTDRAPESVSITTDDNLISRISTTVSDDGVLRIEAKENAWLDAKSGLVIEVGVGHLYEFGASGAAHISAAGGIVCHRLAISASGASHIELDALTGAEAVIWASGASQVSVRDLATMKATFDVSGASKLDIIGGTVGDIEAFASGGSTVQLGGVTAQNAKLNLSGGSTAAVSAVKAVSGSLSGGSTAEVSGNPPERTVESSGGSNVTYSE